MAMFRQRLRVILWAMSRLATLFRRTVPQRPPAFPGLDRAPAAVLILWTSLYVWRALSGHASLHTNAYDLSMLDYALWNSLHGRPGFVPFIGHSIHSHHFTPILWLLTPVYAVFQSPVCLILLQILATAGAGWLFHRFARRLGVERVIALALLAVFLMSRRTHSATTSFFYPECFQAVLTFAVVAAWNGADWLYWTSAALWLTTKEDAALYLGAFGALQLLSPEANRRAALTILLAIVWATAAVGLFVPMSRAADGLSSANPLFTSRFSSDGGMLDPATLVLRPISPASLGTWFNLLATTGFLPILGWKFLAAAVPGIVANSAAKPEMQQAALIGHYFWPVMPWLFMATAAGALRLQRRSLRAARLWVLLLLCGTLADNTAVRRLTRSQVDPEATTVLNQLGAVKYGAGAVLLAQTDLIPHLAHSNTVFAIGGEQPPPRPPDLVLATRVGDLWPLTPEEVDSLIRSYAANVGYEQISGGPLYAFRLRPTR